jgi:hypothetical protein
MTCNSLHYGYNIQEYTLWIDLVQGAPVETALYGRKIRSFKGGWIYAAQEVDTPLVKIGYTWEHTPMRRLMSLWRQYKVPISFVALVYVPRAVFTLEHRVHAFLAPYRIEGEWFYLHMNQAKLEAIIRELTPALTAQVKLDKSWLRFGPFEPP